MLSKQAKRLACFAFVEKVNEHEEVLFALHTDDLQQLQSLQEAALVFTQLLGQLAVLQKALSRREAQKYCSQQRDIEGSLIC